MKINKDWYNVYIDYFIFVSQQSPNTSANIQPFQPPQDVHFVTALTEPYFDKNCILK